MTKRQLIAAGNWKMNLTYLEGLALVEALVETTTPNQAMMILAVPFIHLKEAADMVAKTPHIKLAAQNCADHESGAYTGEISVAMIQSTGATHVILGHSERREYYGEINALLATKVNLVLEKLLTPIFCCGESLSIREAGAHVAHVATQLKEGLFHLSAEEFKNVIIAYEPIWAIGTGVTASPQQAQDMQREIRQLIAAQYGADIADECSILYGGSVKPANAKELFSQPDVDGGLVGGASLNAAGFAAIYDSF